MTSLFGYLALKFGPQPENLAIDALGYVLDRSTTATAVLARMLAAGGEALPADIRFRTQAAGDDGARPDLEGATASAGTVALVEMKFHAGLTEHQPVTYIHRLPPHPPAMLAFLVPAVRFTPLWNELARRCTAAGITVGPVRRLTAEHWTADLTEGRRLALLSWRYLLDEMGKALAVERDAVAADVAQLAGLCDRMDADFFMPLRSEELTARDIPIRQLQFDDLIGEIVEKGTAAGLWTRTNRDGVKLAPSRQSLGSGHYVNIGGFTFLLTFDHHRWARLCPTPLWLRTADTMRDQLADALAALRSALPPRVFEDEREFWLPLTLPTGVEKPEVVEAILAQVGEVAACIVPARDEEAPAVPRRLPYVLATYNGFDHAARVAVNPIQNAAVREGRLARPDACSICGFSDTANPKGRGYIFMHLEDYGRPLDILPTCKKCHAALHARFKDPARWQRIVDAHFQPGRWYTLLTMKPEDQTKPYSEIYPNGLPGAWEVWVDDALPTP